MMIWEFSKGSLEAVNVGLYIQRLGFLCLAGFLKTLLDNSVLQSF